MPVKVARTAGFCMGVRRAMNIVLDAVHRGDDPICTLGPLIHNRHVVDLLAKKGVSVIEDVSQVADSTVIVRAHGVPPEVREQLERDGATVRDATCPHVKKVQFIVKRHAADGYSVLIVGDPGHAEVEGLLGYAGGKGIVISSVADLDRLTEMDKVCVVGQTTQDAEKFLEISREAAQRYENCVVFDTLCDSTHRRQAEMRELARQADAAVVVGGYNSANTKRLADIARSTGVPTFHVESADDLSDVPMDTFRNVVVTAGASTPNWLIKGVVEEIDRIQQRRAAPVLRALLYTMKFLQDSGIHVSAGAALLTYASCLLQEIPVRPEYLVLAFAYVFAMQHLMYYTDRAAAAYNEPSRAMFYEKHKVFIISVGLGGVVTALGFSLALGVHVFWLVLLAAAVGVAYNVRIVPEKFVRLLRYRRPRDIPASKDIFTAVGWAVVTVGVPLLHVLGGITGRSAVTLFFVFVIAFIRSVIVDVRHIQGDRIIGKETIAIVIGKERTKVLLGVMAALLAIVLFLAAYRGVVSSLGYYLIACVAYACVYLYLYHERIIFQGVSFEGVVDSNFWLAGIIALLWHIVVARGLVVGICTG
jgi:(E)-4-hydroxy-3-methyl-but-2-enyl pyrophosphate reductase